MYVGDCTERPITCRFNQFYSHYKGKFTVKHNVICTLNGYITDISPAYTGATTDNMLHSKDKIIDRISRAHGDNTLPTVYLYDKGFTASELCHAKGIAVLTPLRKLKGQVVWSDDQVRLDRAIARRRVVIENIMSDLRRWACFNHRIPWCSATLADTHARCACIFANFLPVRKQPKCIK